MITVIFYHKSEINITVYFRVEAHAKTLKQECLRVL